MSTQKGMNITEKKAFSWLLSKGYRAEDIIFSRKKSPDFRCTDGKSFEIKRAYGKMIMFTAAQFQYIKSLHTPIVLVFADNQDEPIASIPVDELVKDKTVRHFKIYIASAPRVYIDNSLIEQAIKRWPDVALISGMTNQVDFILRKALELPAQNTKR
jgi:hypothetical protein